MKSPPEKDKLEQAFAKIVEEFFRRHQKIIRKKELDRILKILKQDVVSGKNKIESEFRSGNEFAFIASTTCRLIAQQDAEKKRLLEKFESLKEKYAQTENDRRLKNEAANFIEQKQRLIKGKRFRLKFKETPDWETVTESCKQALFSRDAFIELLVVLAGGAAALLIRNVQKSAEGKSFLDKIDLENTLRNHFALTERLQNRLAVLQGFFVIADSAAKSHGLSLLTADSVDLIKQLTLDDAENVWVRAAAFKVLFVIDIDRALSNAEDILLNAARNAGPDDMFLRNDILEILMECSQKDRSSALIVKTAETDPSDLVRQTCMKAAAKFDLQQALSLLEKTADAGTAFENNVKVRAKAALESANIVEKILKNEFRNISEKQILNLLIRILRNEREPLVLRAALDSVLQAAELRRNAGVSREIGESEQEILSAIDALIVRQEMPSSVKSWAAETRERIIVPFLPGFRDFNEYVAPHLKSMNEGGIIRIPSKMLPSDTLLGRFLAYFSMRDFGWNAAKGTRKHKFYKGDFYTKRLWRIWHEIKHPAPDKRKGYLHSVGRRMFGLIRAPSRILAETGITEVPGERRYSDNFQTWQPYIPMPDDFLSLSSGKIKGKTVKIFSCEGITSIQGPAGPAARLRNKLKISLNYPGLSDLRNQTSRGDFKANCRRYLKYVEKNYGIKTTFEPHSYQYQGKNFSVTDPNIEAAFKPEDSG